jgi:hypothetical protein
MEDKTKLIPERIILVIMAILVAVFMFGQDTYPKVVVQGQDTMICFTLEQTNVIDRSLDSLAECKGFLRSSIKMTEESNKMLVYLKQRNLNLEAMATEDRRVAKLFKKRFIWTLIGSGTIFTTLILLR